MVKVQMHHHDCLNVFNVVAGLPNCSIQFLVLNTIFASKSVVELWTLDVLIVLAGTSFGKR